MKRIAQRRIVMVACGLTTAVAAAQFTACSGDDSTSGGVDASTELGNGDTFVPPNPPPPPPPADAQADADAGACLGATDAAGLDDATVQAGMGFVLAYNCAKCHQTQPADAGLSLEGKTTTIVDGGLIYPKNLTPDHATGIGCWTDTQIVNGILNGIDDEGQTLCVMPKFASKMDAGTAEMIATFLRTLPAVNHDIPETTCPVTDAGSDADASDAGDAD
jgi:hypothetical protein